MHLINKEQHGSHESRTNCFVGSPPYEALCNELHHKTRLWFLSIGQPDWPEQSLVCYLLSLFASVLDLWVVVRVATQKLVNAIRPISSKCNGPFIFTGPAVGASKTDQ